MADQFADCLAFVLREEGGWSDNPQDHGGATQCGLTMPDLWHWDRDATTDDLRAMPADLIAALYRALYWQPLRADALWPGLDLMTFDMGVNAGVGTAARELQRLLSVTVDGVIGPVTCAAARQAPFRDGMLVQLHGIQMAAYQSMRQFPVFGAGWMARCYRRLAAAQAMLNG